MNKFAAILLAAAVVASMPALADEPKDTDQRAARDAVKGATVAIGNPIIIRNVIAPRVGR